MQQALRRETGPINPQPLIIRVIYSSWFYLSIASGLGALAGWAILEPFIDEGRQHANHEFPLAGLLLFPVVAAGIGLFLGAAEGIMCRNMSRAAICGLVGLGIGFGGGLIAIFVAGVVFYITQMMVFKLWVNPQPNTMPTGLALLVLMMGRGGLPGAAPRGIGPRRGSP